MIGLIHAWTVLQYGLHIIILFYVNPGTFSHTTEHQAPFIPNFQQNPQLLFAFAFFFFPFYFYFEFEKPSRSSDVRICIRLNSRTVCTSSWRELNMYEKKNNKTKLIMGSFIVRFSRRNSNEFDFSGFFFFSINSLKYYKFIL